MTMRASARLCTSSGIRRFHVPPAEYRRRGKQSRCKVQRLSWSENQPPPADLALKIIPVAMPRPVQMVEVIHCGAAQFLIVQNEAAQLDNIHPHAQTGAKPHHGAAIGRHVGLIEGEAQICLHGVFDFGTGWSKLRRIKHVSLGSPNYDVIFRRTRLLRPLHL